MMHFSLNSRGNGLRFMLRGALPAGRGLTLRPPGFSLHPDYL